jgi:glycerol-3-phosphate acyltransferase PlsY
VFAIVVVATRWVSLSSILAAIAVPAAGAWFYGKDNPLLAWALAVIGLLVVVKHRSNIRRLLNGTEPRIVGRNRLSRRKLRPSARWTPRPKPGPKNAAIFSS